MVNSTSGSAAISNGDNALKLKGNLFFQQNRSESETLVDYRWPVHYGELNDKQYRDRTYLESRSRTDGIITHVKVEIRE